MSAWTRTTKPVADTTINPDNIFGVDAAEVAATAGITAPGWVHRKDLGNGRIVYETLAAMKVGPDEVSDDASIPDLAIMVTTQPVNRSVVAPAATTFVVAAATTPAGGTITYQWETSTDGLVWADATGGVYTGGTTATLSISNSTGLTGRLYRCELTSTGGAIPKYSAVVTLTVS